MSNYSAFSVDLLVQLEIYGSDQIDAEKQLAILVDALERLGGRVTIDNFEKVEKRVLSSIEEIQDEDIPDESSGPPDSGGSGGG